MEQQDLRKKLLTLCSYVRFSLRNVPGVESVLTYSDNSPFKLMVLIRQLSQEIHVDIALEWSGRHGTPGPIALRLIRLLPDKQEEVIQTIALFGVDPPQQNQTRRRTGSEIFEWDRRINQVIGDYRIEPTSDTGVWLIE
jgi:hypothetical protein